MKQQKTDILIVGMGLAGITAAITAAQSGKQVTIITKTKPIVAYQNWNAPKDSPKAIQINRKISSSGSFIGVLNRTIDKAPTRPKDNASDDLTTVIIIVTIKVSKTKFEDIWFLSEIDLQ